MEAKLNDLMKHGVVWMPFASVSDFDNYAFVRGVECVAVSVYNEGVTLRIAKIRIR